MAKLDMIRQAKNQAIVPAYRIVPRLNEPKRFGRIISSYPDWSCAVDMDYNVAARMRPAEGFAISENSRLLTLNLLDLAVG
jgi:hypothetical protein